MGGARKFREKYAGVEGFEIHGYDRYIYTYIADKFQGDIQFDTSLIRTATLDIECECEGGFPDPMIAGERVNAITIKPFGKDAHVFGIGEWEHNRTDIVYHNCMDEAVLLTEFMKYWRQEQFDIITGWNVDSFDMTYLCNRVDRLFGEGEHKKFSPWNMSDVREYTSQGYQRNMTYTLYGINIVDYLDLYRKHTFVNQESYRLDHISNVELGTGKIDYSEYGSLHTLYRQDYPKFLEYNLKDAVLVEQLEEKLGLLELTQVMSYNAKCNYTDTFGMVKYWETIIYNFLKEQKIQTPPQRLKTGNDKMKPIVGAYVKEPIVGGHNWVMSFDLNSLYPHLIMQYNMSPETLVTGDYLKLADDKTYVNEMLREIDLDIPEKTTITPNGALYRTDKLGFLPEMMQDIYNDRTVYKKKMLKAKQDYEDTKDPKYQKYISRYNNIQMARKISLNSAYGAIGNQYFRYYDLAIAEGITTAGQLSIRWIEKKINEYLNKLLGTTNEDFVIASDTDSIYVTFDKLVNRVFKEGKDIQKIVNFLDTIAQEKIEPFIDKSYQALSTYVNAYDQKMQMKREVIADKGIWTAKKRYILNAWDVEGVRFKEPQLKIMGIEAVKSSTPAPCRAKIKEALKIIMSGSEKELNDFLIEFRKKFDELPPEEIAYPRSVNGVKKFYSDSSIYRKGTPMHIKGALVYNHMIKERKLTRKYPTIQNGDKIKYLELRQPNPLGCNVISFPAKLPKELDIYKYIDYDSQYEKSFIDPLSFITNNIGWKIDRSFGTQTTLEAFFG